MLFREKMPACSKSHIKHINSLSEDAELLMFKLVVYRVTTVLKSIMRIYFANLPFSI